MALLLEVTDLAIEVGPGARAVDGISFALEPGRTLALCGESGSGKSLAALACVRLLPAAARVAAGEIRWRGRSVLGLSGSEMRAIRGREIGFVFQEPMTALHPGIRAGDQVAEAMLVHERSLGAREARTRAVALLGRVGLDDPERRARAYPHELSGGQRQRVLIAMALAAGPAALLADEPTTALDPSLRREVLGLIRALQRERGLAVLLVSHDLALVRDFADEIAVLYAGRIVERGPAARVLDAPEHPYTRALLACVPSVDERRPRLQAIPGMVPGPRERPGGCRFRTRCPIAEAACAAREPALEPRRGRGDHLAACIKS